jgi:hypothetical protein
VNHFFQHIGHSNSFKQLVRKSSGKLCPRQVAGGFLKLSPPFRALFSPKEVNLACSRYSCS